MKEWRAWLDVVASIVMALAAGLLAWQLAFGQTQSPTQATDKALPTRPIPLTGAPTLGSRYAPVGLLIYSDFECPYCRRFARETLPTIIKEFVEPGRVQVAFRHSPNPTRLRESAAALAVCAHRKNRFWPFHDILFAADDPIVNQETLTNAWQSAGLSAGEMANCKADPTADEQVRIDLEGGQALGVRATPTFFVGLVDLEWNIVATRRIVGARPINAFREAIAAVLSTINRVP